MKPNSLFISLFLLMSLPAWAYHPEDGIDINTVLTNFDFAEYNDMQQAVVTEKGLVYGAEVEFKTTFNRVYFQANAGLHRGTVQYDGQTQVTGESHQTSTIETIADYSVSIGRAYETWRRHDYSFIYASFGYHQWVRDIQTRDGVAGLFEVYRWPYVSLGARGYLFRLGPVHFFGEVSIARTMVPKMTLNSGGQFDDTELDLGEHFGARVVLPVRVILGRRFQFNIEPFYESWDLGRSEHVDLTQQSIVVGGVHEPRSETRLYGVNLGFSMRFN